MTTKIDKFALDVFLNFDLFLMLTQRDNTANKLFNTSGKVQLALR